MEEKAVKLPNLLLRRLGAEHTSDRQRLRLVKQVQETSARRANGPRHQTEKRTGCDMR